MARPAPWAAVALSALLTAPLALRLARADIPPPDSCGASARAGDPCTNAGPGHDQPGRCVATTCRRANPMAPGGVLEHGCLLCLPSAGGRTPDAAYPDGSRAPGGKGSAGEADGGGRGGAVAPELGGGLVAALLVAIGAGGLLLTRRRP